MTRPTNDELEAIAAGVLAQTSWGVPLDAEFAQKTAAMLRACKAGDAPDHCDWNAAIEAAARAQEAAYRKGIFGEKHSDHIRTLKKGPPQ